MSKRNKKYCKNNIPKGEEISYKGIPSGTKVKIPNEIKSEGYSLPVPKGTIVTLINDRGEFEYGGKTYCAGMCIVV